MPLKQSDCFSINKKFWTAIGLYSTIDSKMYVWYSRTVLFIFIFFYDSMNTLNFYYAPRDMDHFIEELIFYFMELSVISKVLTFILMRESLTTILSMLESEKFEPDTEKGVQIATDAMKFNVKYWRIVAFVSYFSYIVHILSNLIAHFIFSVPLVLPLCSYSFLTDSFKERFLYPLYTYQYLGMHAHIICNLNIDTFFLGLMIFTIAQLEILEDKLVNSTNISQLPISKTGNRNSSNLNELQFVKNLNKCVIKYTEISHFCDLVEDFFSITLFVQFGIASCVICVCLFRFTLPASVQYYMFLGSYMFVMTIQIAVPCWFGTRIIVKSSLLSEAIYNCDWTPRPRRFKSSMRLFVERANRPLSVTGWKMFPLSLNTFTSIMNSAYSFFTLLRYMQTREH